MKTFLGVLLCAITAISCTQKANYKTERDEVMKFHDVVMEDHGSLVANEMKIDSLMKDLPALKKEFPELDTLREKGVLKATLERLTVAENLMNDWMHKFEPDVTGKSDEDAVQYFKNERVKIARIDSLYKVEIKSSTTYLTKFRK